MSGLAPLRHLTLVGFSGSGKSSAGRLVAKQLRMRFEDIDKIVEDMHGISISEIFLTKGEKFFRNEEKLAIRATVEATQRKCVIAVGGGGFEEVRMRKLLLDNTVVVYLKCSQAEIVRRLIGKTDRPLLNVKTKEKRNFVRSLMARRRKHYELAHIAVSTTGKTIPEVAREICRKYKAYDIAHV
jgi:shikimate kinase